MVALLSDLFVAWLRPYGPCAILQIELAVLKMYSLGIWASLMIILLVVWTCRMIGRLDRRGALGAVVEFMCTGLFVIGMPLPTVMGILVRGSLFRLGCALMLVVLVNVCLV